MGQMTMGKWIALAVVLAVVGFVVLTQFTSFQVPRSVTGGDETPAVHPGIQPESTTTENNLDTVNEIIRGESDKNQPEESGDGN
ncbi:MAG: hypothetical protein JJ911_19500 [Rhizobiaceae bacterium]|nr:hypothetical protein [Rhizobiaceae bacterium]